MSNANDDVKVNKKFKDSLFRKLFGENEENAISLYNAVNDTQYTIKDGFEYTTLEDVVYMKMKNCWRNVLFCENMLFLFQK